MFENIMTVTKLGEDCYKMIFLIIKRDKMQYIRYIIIQNSQKTGLHNEKMKDYQLCMKLIFYSKNKQNRDNIVYAIKRIVNTACYKVGRSVTKFSTL